MDHIRCLAYFLILLLLHCPLSGCRKDGPISIRLGMKLDAVMSSLAADGIPAKQNEGQYALPGDPPSKRFIIRSPASPDALYLYFADRGPDPAYRLEVLQWHFNWAADAKRAKGQRRDDEHRLDEVDVKRLAEWVKSGRLPISGSSPSPSIAIAAPQARTWKDLSARVGEVVESEGRAGNFSAGPAIVLDDDRPLYIEGPAEWPRAIQGTRVRVTGTVVKHAGLHDPLAGGIQDDYFSLRNAATIGP
jgi:hypothetical protein